MVNIQIIEKTITEVINTKCHVTLKQVRSSIQQTIKLISDNTEEYDALMDIIPRFYRDYYNKKQESLLIQDYDGNKYTSDGTINKVQHPKQAEEIGEKEGLLLSIHNHPGGCSLLSSNDVYNSGRLNEKYSMVVSKDGVTILKNSNPYDLDPLRDVTWKWTSVTFPKISKPIENSEEYKKIVADYFDGKIPQLEMIEAESKLTSKFIDAHRIEIYSELQNVFNKNNLPITINYIKV